jgi:hypothetical protein
MSQDSAWYIPPTAVRLADGSTLIRPGKAVQRARGSLVAKWTGVPRKTLAALADCGLIRRCHPSPGVAHYYPAEVEALIARTEDDPDFWNQVRVRAYLTGRRLRKSSPG